MEESKTLQALQVEIPTEGAWFDREDTATVLKRTYWVNGEKVLVACAFLRHEGEHSGQWTVEVAWLLREGEAEEPKGARHQFGPFAQAGTANQVLEAVGIGVHAARTVQHISKIPGARPLEQKRD